MRLLLFFALSIIHYYCNAQSAVISAEEMNVLYIGLENPIKVAIPGVPLNKTVVKSSIGTLIKTDSNFHILIPYRISHECIISVGKIKRKDTIWVYSKKFKVRNVPKPKLRIGPMDPDLPMNISAFKVSKAIYAVVENFVYEGVRYSIASYQAHIIDPKFGYRFIRSKSSSLSPLLDPELKLNPSSIIILDSVLITGPNQFYTAPLVCRFQGSEPSQIIIESPDSTKFNLFLSPTKVRHFPKNFKIHYSNDSIQSHQTWTNGKLTAMQLSNSKSGNYFNLVGNQVTIVHNSDSASGRIEDATTFVDTGLSILNSSYVFNNISIVNRHCDRTNDTINFLFDFFKPLRNMFFPVGNWTFYHEGKPYATGSLVLGSDIVREVYSKEGWNCIIILPKCENLMFGRQSFSTAINSNQFLNTNIYYYLLPGGDFKFYKNNPSK